MQLHDALESVSDAASFLVFARLLASDRINKTNGSDVNGWQNNSIEDFLESAIAWAESTDIGLSQGLSASNPWKRFAVFLYSGKIYE